MIAVVSTAGKDALDDAFAVTLQDSMFSEYMRADDSYDDFAFFICEHEFICCNSSPVPSPNQRAIAELFAAILGHLAKAR